VYGRTSLREISRRFFAAALIFLLILGVAGFIAARNFNPNMFRAEFEEHLALLFVCFLALAMYKSLELWALARRTSRSHRSGGCAKFRSAGSGSRASVVF